MTIEARVHCKCADGLGLLTSMNIINMASQVILLREGFVAKLTDRTLLSIHYNISRILMHYRFRRISRYKVSVVVMMLVLHVNSQVTRTRKNRLALLTNKSLLEIVHGGSRLGLLTMNSLLMTPQVVVSRKILRTVVAVIRFQFAMHLQ